MRKILFQLGRICAILFPYSMYNSFCNLQQWFYTGYRTRKFKAFGKNSKMGFAMHIVGEENIVIDDNVIFGGGVLR